MSGGLKLGPSSPIGGCCGLRGGAGGGGSNGSKALGIIIDGLGERIYFDSIAFNFAEVS